MRACVACGAEDLREHLRVRRPRSSELTPTTTDFGAAASDILRCRCCSHMQVEHPPPAELLEASYGEAASADYVEEEAGQRVTARRALARIARNTSPGHLLDVGCWTGFLLSEAVRAGWRATGLEPSQYASSFAREQLGLEVRRTDLFAAELQPGSYRAVVLADVIEHLLEPAAALDRIATLLDDRGVLYLELPDAGSRLARLLGHRWWSVIPTHLQYFTRRSLATLLRRCGWEIRELSTAPKSFTFAYYLGRLAGYDQRVADAAERGAEKLGLAGRLVTPDFGDRMAVVAVPARSPEGRRD